MGKPDMQAAIQHILSRLRNELPKELHFHSVSHTEDYVLPATMLFARHEGVKGEDLILLTTAAAYHDSGFLVRYTDNEQIAVDLARQALPGYRYTPLQIDRIAEIIMSTKMHKKGELYIQQPDESDLLQLILCDADMDALGRKEFFLVGESLRLEYSFYERTRGLKEWMHEQLAFQEGHSYFTKAAKGIRGNRKNDNIRQLRELLMYYKNK